MTNSRSTALKNSWLTILVILVGLAGSAHAGRKRVVVFDFEGPKGEKFHDDVVKLVRAKHTVIPTEKWTSTADELDAAKTTDKNIKKVARKLKIDAIVSGKIEKRRDEYIISIKILGSDGEIVNNVNTKSESARVDSGATRDLNAELVTAIDQIEKSSGGGGDDEDAKPAKKPAKKPAADDDEDAKPAKKGFSKHLDDETGEDKVAPKKAAKKADDDDGEAKPEVKKPVKKVIAKKSTDDDEDAKPAKKAAKKSSDDDGDEDKPKKKKKVAAGDDAEGEPDKAEGDDADPSVAALSPGQRAVDARFGLSFMARRMAFTYSPDLGSKAPPGYKGVPAPGLYIDATLFPAAISHKRDDIVKDLGVSVMVDKALLLSSQVTPPGGVATKLSTSMTHYAIGVAFRHAFGKDASAPVFEANLRYGGQSFSISPTATVTTALIDIPDVSYKMLEPMIGIKYPASPKLVIDATIGLQLVTSQGPITTMTQYGDASVMGFSGEIGGDYMVTKNLFLRAAFRFNTIGFTFKGTGTQSTMRDADAAQDVFGARDTYIGGAITAGYVY